MDFIFSMKKSLVEGEEQNLNDAETIIKGKMSDLNVFFTPYIYQMVNNITKLLSPEENSGKYKKEDKQQMINEKN